MNESLIQRFNDWRNEVKAVGGLARWVNGGWRKAETAQEEFVAPVAMPPAPSAPASSNEVVVGNVNVPVTQGWVTLRLSDIFEATPVLLDVFQHYRDTVGGWHPNIPASWWTELRPYTRTECMMQANYMRAMFDEADIQRLKERLTASALIFDHDLPRACFTLNESIIETVLRYLALTETASINISAIDVWEEFLPMPDKLEALVAQFLWHLPLSTALFSEKPRPPSLFMIRTMIIPTMNLKYELTDKMVKKILTCIYLAGGVSIPLDYIYVDMDVHDFVLKHGEYERLDKKS